MNWAAVISGLITGTVGVAGIGGTIMSASLARKSAAENLQTSISAEDKRAKQAGKRRIYANSLAALTFASTAHLRYTPGGPSAAAVVATNAVAEVKLIASPEVADLATEAILLLTKVNKMSGQNELADAIGKLTRVMRIELGELV
jgi:hypothetical protein